MKRILKKYFIPHEANEHKPHFLRSETTLAILGGVLLIEIVFLLQLWAVIPSGNLLGLVLPNVLVDATNQTRTEAEFGSLRVNEALVRAAQAKAQDMAAKGYFSHVSPDGVSPWYWLEQSGYSFLYAGENLAVNFSDSEDVIKAWMDSPGHRANILNGKFTEIGIATAFGKYKGKDTVFVVEFFGRPSVVASKPTSQPTVVFQTEQVSDAPDMFVAVKGAEAEAIIEMTAAEAPFIPQSTNLEKLAVSPKTATNYAFVFVSVLVFLALALNILIKVRVQHPRLILNGFLMLLAIGAVLAINQHLTLYNTQIF